MDRDRFAARFAQAHVRALELARPMVVQALSAPVRFVLKPNSSHSSETLIDDEEIFPEDTPLDPAYVGPLTEDETVNWLWRRGKVPEWIDLAVLQEDGQYTTIGLLCSGRFTSQNYLLYHQDEGYPPFHATPPRPPQGWDSVSQHGRFSLYWQPEDNGASQTDKP